MKSSDAVKEAIKAYLDYRAATDELFAERYANPDKNIDDCITYILNEVKNSGRNGFADDEIYSMAIHYYDEKDIKVGKPLNGKVVVHHTIELTEEEKAEARKQAIARYQDEEIRKMRERRKAQQTSTHQSNKPQPSLFDM